MQIAFLVTQNRYVNAIRAEDRMPTLTLNLCSFNFY